MKLRKFKKAQEKAARDAQRWKGGVPVMDASATSAPALGLDRAVTPAAGAGRADGGGRSPAASAVAIDIAEAVGAAGTSGSSDTGEAAIAPEGHEERPAASVEDAGQAQTDAAQAERIDLAETMYRAAQARFEAAEALELSAGRRLQEAEAAEQAATERLSAAEAGERAFVDRLVAAEEHERALADRLAAAEAREQAAAERIAAADGREQAVSGRIAAAEARERAAAERDAIANERDRTAAERDAIANERDRASLERGGRSTDRPAIVPSGASAAHELEIARLEAELERAHLDSLTGALRREIGRLTLHNEIERARRSDGRFVLAFVDVDDLKGINDREGHAAGDRVLRTLAATLRANLRTYDPVVRYGGDEFVCGVTGVSASELEHRMTLIDQSLRRATGVGISAGIATLREGETLDEITARADEALLEAKRSRD